MSGSSPIEAVLQRVRLLATPTPGKKDERAALVEATLIATLQAAEPVRYASFTLQAGDPRQHMALLASQIITDLCSAIRLPGGWSGPDIPSDLLVGMKDRQHVRTLAEITVAWGIYPALLPGVGIPLARRAKNARFDLRTTRKGTVEELSICVQAIRRLIEEPQFAGEMSASHLIDLFAAYGQISDAPDSHYDSILVREAQVTLSEIVSTARVDLAMESLMALMNSRPPPWFARCCGRLLSQLIQRPGGVHVVIDALIVADQTATAADYERAVRIISAVPQGVSRQQYLAAVFSQLVPLIASDQEHHASATLQILHSLWDADAVGRFFVVPLLEPLAAYVRGAGAALAPPDVVALSVDSAATERSVGRAIVALGRIAKSGGGLLNKLQGPLSPLIAALLDLLAFSWKGVAPLKEPLFDVCVAVLGRADAARLIASSVVPVASLFAFANGPSGGVCLARREQQSESAESEEQRAECLCELAAALHDDAVYGDLFVELLRRSVSGGAGAAVAAQMLSSMCGRLSPGVFRNISQLCALLKEVLQGTEAETVLVCLTILETLLGGQVAIDADQAFLIYGLLPSLETLRRGATGSVAVSMSAARVIQLIAAPAPLWTKNRAEFGSEGAVASSVEGPLPSVVEDILEELRDPLIAVRGHALVRLRRHVLARDPLVCARLGEVMDILLGQLASPEEIVYLTAANALSAVGDIFPAEALGRLSRAYCDASLSIGSRLCCGEALVQAAVLQGVMLPARATAVIPAVFAALRDAIPEIRASALSLLGTLCGTMKLASHSIATDAVSAARSLLESDGEPLVRRGAAQCLAEFIESLGATALNVVGKALLRDARTTAAASSHYDADIVVREHCQGVVVLIDDCCSASLLGLVEEAH